MVVNSTDTDCTGTDVLALAWNGLNQLIQASRAGAGSTETYAYDDSGRRIGKTAGASTTRYQYDGPDILAEYGGASAEPIALYAHGAGMDEPLMRLTGDAESPQAQVAYYVQDGVGSVVATFGEPEPSVNLAREPGVVITQGSGGSYTVAGAASNPATLNNGETRASGGHWTVTSGRTLDIVLAGSRSVSEVVLVGNPGTTDDPLPNEGGTWPADSQFDTSRYTVQTWSGSAWQTVGSVSGNTLHIRRVSFAPVTTDRIRVIPTDDASNGQTPNDNLVSLTEIEVRSPAGAGQVATQRFDAWGRVEQAAGSVPTYGYTGREPDVTGLVYYRARYYHPDIGQFVSRDPLGLSAGINPYAYADGNPVLFNDPDGLMAALAWNSASSYWTQNNVGTRLGGALQAAGGAAEFAIGGAVGLGTGWTGIGAVAGGGLMLLGADQASAGFQTLISGQSRSSLLNQGLQAAGASPTQAAWGEAAINIGAGAGASALLRSGETFAQGAAAIDDAFSHGMQYADRVSRLVRNP